MVRVFAVNSAVVGMRYLLAVMQVVIGGWQRIVAPEGVARVGWIQIAQATLSLWL